MTRYFPNDLRRRLAPIALIGGILAVGHMASTEMPRDQEIRIVLPPGDLNIKSVRVSYLASGETISVVDFLPDADRGRMLFHSPSLKPGRYDVKIEVSDQHGAGVRVLSRSLVVPADPVTIRLDPSRPP